jgi:hypothetical protein
LPVWEPVPFPVPPLLLLKQFSDPTPAAQTNNAARTPERDWELELMDMEPPRSGEAIGLFKTNAGRLSPPR